MTGPDLALDSYKFPDNKYKLHACCHGLHPMIEALQASEAAAGVPLDDIKSFSLSTNPRWLAVCDIKRPRTGLEVKFSYNWLAGMTLRATTPAMTGCSRTPLPGKPSLDVSQNGSA